LSPSPVLAASGSPSFAGKTIRITVGYSPGGGFDTLSRLLARHMSRHFPGNSTILVANMPGAGGAVSFNYVYSRAKPDGRTWVTSDGALILSKILGIPGPNFDVEKFSWLGVVQESHTVCLVMTRTGIKTADQFLKSKKRIRIASTVPGDSVHIRPLMVAQAVGANFKLILGYRGTSGMRLAMHGNEAGAACWGWQSMKVTGADMMKRKEAIPILQIGFGRHPDLPKVPTYRGERGYHGANHAGAVHWGFGGGPQKKRVHIDGIMFQTTILTNGTPIVERGRLKALDDPKIRELASKYGEPDRILAEAL